MVWLRRRQSAPPRAHWFSTSALREALRAGGCPVCVAVWRSERRGIRSFLYEGMMSPSVRHNFLEAGGFCARHFWMAKEIEEECWPAGGIGTAILCEDIVRRYLAAAERLAEPAKRAKAVPPKPGSGCIFCRDSEHKERALVEVLEELVNKDEFALPLRAGRLCLQHAQLAIESWSDGPNRGVVLTALRELATELLADLREFIRKHDYQHRHEQMGREAESVMRSADFILGQQHMRGRRVA